MTELIKHEPTTIYIKPSKGLAALNLRDLWVYRELIFFMVWRDVKVKYKQTLLGMAWAVIQPVMTMLIFTFLFDRVAKLPTEGIPYPVFSFTALLPWGLFVVALNQGSRSLVASRTAAQGRSAVPEGVSQFVSANVVPRFARLSTNAFCSDSSRSRPSSR